MTDHQDSPGPAGQLASILLRAVALALVAVAIALVLSLVGGGLRAVAVGAVLVLGLVCGTACVWAARDARRSPSSRLVVVRWGLVSAIAAAGYVTAGLVAPGSYGAEMPLVTVIVQAVVLATVLVLAPAALGTAWATVRQATKSGHPASR